MNRKKSRGFLMFATVVAAIVLMIAVSVGMTFVKNNPDIFKPDIKPSAMKEYYGY